MFVLLNIKEFQSLMIINKNQDTTKVVNSNMFDIWSFSKLCDSVPLLLCNYSTKVAVFSRLISLYSIHGCQSVMKLEIFLKKPVI